MAVDYLVQCAKILCGMKVCQILHTIVVGLTTPEPLVNIFHFYFYLCGSFSNLFGSSFLRYQVNVAQLTLD